MTIIYFILILGIVVLVHETGHFLFAKKAGVYVYEFSIGMGPRLFKWKRKKKVKDKNGKVEYVEDETEYSIRLLPIGGYVQMAGEEIEVDDNNKVNLYFENTYELFLTPAEDMEFQYYDGYLTIDTQNNKAEIEIVVISDNDDRIYYTYEPTKEETEKLIKAANKYCQECYDQDLEEFYNEIIDEEEENNEQ